MSELKLGTKHECFNCGTKFYDLGKPQSLCPKCGADQSEAKKADTQHVSQAARRRRKAEVTRPSADEEGGEEVEIEAGDLDDEDLEDLDDEEGGEEFEDDGDD